MRLNEDRIYENTKEATVITSSGSELNNLGLHLDLSSMNCMTLGKLLTPTNLHLSSWEHDLKQPKKAQSANK